MNKVGGRSRSKTTGACLGHILCLRNQENGILVLEKVKHWVAQVSLKVHGVSATYVLY